MSNVTAAMPTTKHPYYSYDGIMSYNAVFNIIPGGRGIGKTFGIKDKVISRAIRNFERSEPIDMFIYLRRFIDETKASKGTFIADIAYKFPKYDFRVDGPKFDMAPTDTRDQKKRDWYTIGYFLSLSTGQQHKSVAYPMVKTIIFDEFIIEKGLTHYLPNEVDVLMNFYVTVDRFQDKTRVFMLSNAVSIDNPYFIQWEIRPDEVKELTVVTRNKDGRPFMVVHFPKSEDFQRSVMDTRFGEFIAGTDYAQFAVGNTFSDNNDRLIMVKDSKAVYMYSLQTSKGVYSIWYSDAAELYYATKKLPRKERRFTTQAELMDEDRTLLTFSDRTLQQLRSAFRSGVLFFDQPSTRNGLLDIFKR